MHDCWQAFDTQLKWVEAVVPGQSLSTQHSELDTQVLPSQVLKPLLQLNPHDPFEHTGLALAGAEQSAEEQQFEFDTHEFVPGQFLYPLWQAQPQLLLRHVGHELAGPAAHWDTSQHPLDEMHCEEPHCFIPALQDHPHWPPLQLAVAPLGAEQSAAEQHAEELMHEEPQVFIPLLQLQLQWPALQVAVAPLGAEQSAEEQHWLESTQAPEGHCFCPDEQPPPPPPPPPESSQVQASPSHVSVVPAGQWGRFLGHCAQAARGDSATAITRRPSDAARAYRFARRTNEPMLGVAE